MTPAQRQIKSHNHNREQSACEKSELDQRSHRCQHGQHQRVERQSQTRFQKTEQPPREKPNVNEQRASAPVQRHGHREEKNQQYHTPNWSRPPCHKAKAGGDNNGKDGFKENARHRDVRCKAAGGKKTQWPVGENKVVAELQSVLMGPNYDSFPRMVRQSGQSGLRKKAECQRHQRDDRGQQKGTRPRLARFRSRFRPRFCNFDWRAGFHALSQRVFEATAKSKRNGQNRQRLELFYFGSVKKKAAPSPILPSAQVRPP